MQAAIKLLRTNSVAKGWVAAVFRAHVPILKFTERSTGKCGRAVLACRKGVEARLQGVARPPAMHSFWRVPNMRLEDWHAI